MSNEQIITLDAAPAQSETPAKKAKADSKPAVVPERTTTGAADGFSGRKVRVVINAGSDDLDKEPVDIGLNGTTWRIKRDEEVVIPEEVFEVLKNAVTTTYKNVGDKVEERAVRRFSYSMLGYE